MCSHLSRPAVLAALLALFNVPASVSADELPADAVVTYEIHGDPQDPNSPVAWVVRLVLTPQARDGDTVSWRVDSVDVRENDAQGEVERAWAASSVTVQTASGWWDVAHADADQPTAADFVEPPVLEATAGPVSGTTEDLEVYLGGGTERPPASTPWSVTGTVDYEFTLAGEPQPEEEGEDEPVGIVPVKPPQKEN